MIKQILSELAFQRARISSGDKELSSLKKSLEHHPRNAASSARWLIRGDAGTFAGNRDTTQAALANTLFVALRRMRDSQTEERKVDFGFENYVIANAHRSISQVFQDLWVLFEHGEKKSGYFVEFGATNGKDISNTCLLEKAFDWKGILAEPNPFWHEALRENRSAEIEVKCVSAKSGDTLELLLTDDPEFATTTNIERQSSKKISVETISLADMLDKYNAPETIDFLSIDTEGSEFDILSAYDFKKNRKIKLIAVEHNFEHPKRADIHELLLKNGYTRKYESYSMFDDWYCLTE